MSKITIVDHGRGDVYPIASNDEAERLVGVFKNLQQGAFRTIKPETVMAKLDSVDAATKLAEQLGLKHFSVLEDGVAKHRMEHGAKVDVTVTD